MIYTINNLAIKIISRITRDPIKIIMIKMNQN